MGDGSDGVRQRVTGEASGDFVTRCPSLGAAASAAAAVAVPGSEQ